MWTSTVTSLTMLIAFAAAYPVTYTNCGLEHTVDKIPERVVTMTQGATEFMLALGLHEHMVGTAYLDDYIWPKYATEYARIEVLASAYPNESKIMSVNPDFIVAGFNSAFRQMYDTEKGPRGIWSNATVAPCAGAGGEELGMTETPSNKLTCRGELNAKGVGTFLFQDACEDTSLRPDVVSEEFVYDEMRLLGSIFKVDVEALITEMKQDFESAAKLVDGSMHGTSLKAVWLDCVGRCCAVEEGEEPQVFVGAGNGAPAMLMNEAGLTNVFANSEGNWACVKESEVIAAAPDVVIVVDAAWDTALSKLIWMYNHSEFCEMDVLKSAKLVQIPFSATSLSPRNGPAALDLAMAALHVRSGSATATQESGVGSFNPQYLKSKTQGLKCTVDIPSVRYGEDTTTTTTTTTTTKKSSTTTTTDEPVQEVSWACGHHSIFVWLCLAVVYRAGHP